MAATRRSAENAFGTSYPMLVPMLNVHAINEADARIQFASTLVPPMLHFAPVLYSLFSPRKGYPYTRSKLDNVASVAIT